MRFADVEGHEELKRQLAAGVDAGRVSHAQLFAGASASGALPLALAYAQYVNCTARRDGDSCGECASCRKYGALAHPDLHFVYPVNSASKSGSQKPLSDAFLPQWRELWERTGGVFDEAAWYGAIAIENQQGLITRNEADETVRKLSFKSFEARYKVVVVWLPERMRTEAANALLKILEEPWERTLFLLVSAEPESLLPTILSRLQRVDVAGGATWEGDGEFFELFAQLMRHAYGDKHMELLEWAESVAAMGREWQKRFLQYSVRMVRENYMLNAGMDSTVGLRGGELDFARKFSPFIANHNVEALAGEMELALAQVAQNGNAKMIFAHFALTVSKLIVRE
jgi:DNA polymerase-3 subunit delta'